MSCHFAFSGDFGSGVRCGCGELDTLAYVRRGCALYADILPDSFDTFNSVEGSEKVYNAILSRREVLKAATRADIGTPIVSIISTSPLNA